MIAPEKFTEELLRCGVTFFAGVPDSLLQNLSSHLIASLPADQHVITANEGAAIGMAIGHHLRTGEIGAVYMQNSGIGNAINPLLSLADIEVYSIPMLLIVGWRGKPGEKDEPQHVKQGRIMEALLSAMELPYFVLHRGASNGYSLIRQAIDSARTYQCPVVVLVEKDVFDHPNYSRPPSAIQSDLPSREDALHSVIGAIGDDAVTVCTTGMLSRELFEYRAAQQAVRSVDFLTVGGMGHASSIALAVALRDRVRDVWCLDGDGALLMHAGTLAVAGQLAIQKYFHVVFNNGVHDSVGGQPTAITSVDLPRLAAAAGYKHTQRIRSLDGIAPAIEAAQRDQGPALIEILVRPGARKNLGRPTTTPIQNKTEFMANISPPRPA